MSLEKDARVKLRVKIKSLAEEARIIRKEERRSSSLMRDSLRCHRIGPVRQEARASILAYGFLRGRRYDRLEHRCHQPPDLKRVKQLVDKYGVWRPWDSDETHKQFTDRQRQQETAWRHWQSEAEKWLASQRSPESQAA